MAWSSQLLLLSIAFCATVSQTFGAKVNFRWCTKGTAEMNKCNKFRDALPNIAMAAKVEIEPACVDGPTAKDCMKKIKGGEADLITLDGGEIYIAGKNYGMVPVVYEDYGGGLTGNSYYAVAVAKKNNTDVTFLNLKGKTSCHTGYQKTAGYNVPVGKLLNDSIMERKGCGENGTAKSVSEFFNKSCIPGSPKEFPNLCELCQNQNCDKSSSNPYYGYAGAFKCMAEGAGDVAFIKHVTVGQEVNKDPSKYGNMSDYDYLCGDGKRKVVTADSYKNCYLSNVPSHAVMTKSGANVKVFQDVLEMASTLCQGNTSATNCSDFEIFVSKSGYSDLLFKESTQKLVAVGDKDTYKKWLGEKYIKTLEGLEDPCPEPPTVAPSRAAFLGPVYTLVLLICGSLLMLFT